MHFIQSLVAAFSVAAAANAAAINKRAVTASQTVASIDQLTQLSEKLQPIVSSIQSGDTAIYKRQANPFQATIQGLQQISNTAQSESQAMDGTSPYGSSDAQKVCTAFSNFAVVQQELLKILIGKSAVVEGIFQGPVAASLRHLENSLDTFAFGIIDAVPVCEADATQKKENLDDTLGKAVCEYTPGGSLGVDLFC